jgi:hypothetical protein
MSSRFEKSDEAGWAGKRKKSGEGEREEECGKGSFKEEYSATVGLRMGNYGYVPHWERERAPEDWHTGDSEPTSLAVLICGNRRTENDRPTTMAASVGGAGDGQKKKAD